MSNLLLIKKKEGNMDLAGLRGEIV